MSPVSGGRGGYRLLRERHVQPALGAQVEQRIDAKQQRHYEADGDDEEIVDVRKAPESITLITANARKPSATSMQMKFSNPSSLRIRFIIVS